MTTILVTGASGIVGYGILKTLRKSGRDFKLVGSTIHKSSVAPAFCDVLEIAPFTGGEQYYPWLIDVVKKHGIDIMIPGIEIDMHSWSANRELFRASVDSVLNVRSLVELCRDKWEFYLDLARRSETCIIPTFSSGRFDELADKCGLPFLLKPKQGYGSKGIIKVNSQEVFQLHASRLGSELIAQPIIGSDHEEFSISCFGDGKGGFLNMFSLRRKLGPAGFTEWAEVVDDQSFFETVSRLCSYFLPLGPTNFQFRTQNGDLKLLEINPRISSATSIRAAFGYNEALMSVDYFLNSICPSVPKTSRGIAIRYLEDHIIR